MKRLLQRLAKFLAYFMAAIVIFLAVAVGLFRLMLPRLPEYQEEIKAWANAAIGMQVEFTGMNARWRFSGPEVNFYNAELLQSEAGDSLFGVEELSFGVGLMRLILDRELVVDRLLIRETSLDLRHADDGSWMLQGIPLDELISFREDLPEGGGSAVTVIGQDISLDYWPPGSQRPLELMIDSLQVERDELQLNIEALVDLPDELGETLELSANRRLGEAAESGLWQLFIDGRSLEIPGWARFQPDDLAIVRSGRADLSLWLERSEDGFRSATGNVVITEFAGGDAAVQVPFEIRGRFEFSRSDAGWLLAADNFRLQKRVGEWPDSSLRVDATRDAAGNILAVDARASFINLDNLQLLFPWVPEEQRNLLNAIGPSGIVHRFELRLAELESDAIRFDLSAELEQVGFNASAKLPGIRGFSGQVRADRSGGRIEIESRDLILDLPQFLGDPISFDDAIGTVIWRRNNDSTIILSDSVRIRNADIDTRSSLQVSLPSDGSSPLIDFSSNWNISDISAVPRYLPVKIMRPRQFDWYDRALVAGIVPRGTVRFTGPLDRFPFESGEGTFRVEAQVKDLTLKFSPKWPAAERAEADVVVENMRFYSNHNAGSLLGNSTVDARVEIADIRQPVLTIDAFATGTLESMRQLSIQSPISKVFGGQLERVAVAGETSFDLQLRYPIRDKLNYAFTTSIRANDGSLSIEGFAPPITELNGLVTVTRDTIQSEGLTAMFLGEPISIDLTHGGEDMPQYAAVASAAGVATADSLIGELGLPFEGRLDGSTGYSAQILFPSRKVENPLPLQIAVETDLQGIGIAYPSPVGKAAESARPLSLRIEFPEPNRIRSFGKADGEINWLLSFLKEDERWDFDRGVVAVGGPEAADPQTRGLHIVGETPELRLNDWLESAPGRPDRTGVGERIRSADLTVDDLYVVGQHLSRHRIRLDRGADEWFIELEGEQAVGSLVVPYDFRSGQPLVVDMQKLILPGSDGQDTDAADPLDPRELPPISIKAAEFALGERNFGSLEVEFAHTAAGLEAASISTKDDNFELNGEAGWVVDAESEEGQRSYLSAKLRSSDVEQTANRLKYQWGIVGDDMEVEIDVSWPGGPREDVLEHLDGSMGIRLGTGQFYEVDPGAGRIFGLMSIVALPRRLSLDFRDVFGKGFGFDQIAGHFRIVSGHTYTCDLSLEGPAADIGIVGRAGLATRDYKQTAIVSASVGDTLPVVGAVVAGPQVAAALLIFSQIFKKPLQEVGQVYYSIDGSFDEPLVEVADADEFASTYEMSGCLPDSE